MTTNAVMPSVEPIARTDAPQKLSEPDVPDTAFRDAIPKLPRGQEIFTRAFAAIAWVYGLYWIIWRWGWLWIT